MSKISFPNVKNKKRRTTANWVRIIIQSVLLFIPTSFLKEAFVYARKYAGIEGLPGRDDLQDSIALLSGGIDLPVTISLMRAYPRIGQAIWLRRRCAESPGRPHEFSAPACRLPLSIRRWTASAETERPGSVKHRLARNAW